MSEVRHKSKSKSKQKEVIEIELEGEMPQIAKILSEGQFWNKKGKLLTQFAKEFNQILFGKDKGTIKTNMKQQDVMRIFETERQKGHKDLPTKLLESVKNAEGKVAGDEEMKRLTKLPVDKFWKEMEVSPEPAKPATATSEGTETEIERLRKENAHLKGQVSQYEIYYMSQEEQERKIKEMSEKLSEVRAEIPAEVINKEPEKKPVDSIAPAPLETLTLDEKQRKIADTFPNTKALQTGCYETVRNTDYSKVHFNASELRPENNYTRGLTNKINVIQKVNVGNLNKYILR